MVDQQKMTDFGPLGEHSYHTFGSYQECNFAYLSGTYRLRYVYACDAIEDSLRVTLFNSRILSQEIDRIGSESDRLN